MSVYNIVSVPTAQTLTVSGSGASLGTLVPVAFAIPNGEFIAMSFTATGNLTRTGNQSLTVQLNTGTALAGGSAAVVPGANVVTSNLNTGGFTDIQAAAGGTLNATDAINAGSGTGSAEFLVSSLILNLTGCDYVLSAAGVTLASPPLTEQTFTVTPTFSAAVPTPPWTAVSDSSWLTVTGGGSGTGNGTITFSVTANQTSFARVGTITVGVGVTASTFVVTQQPEGNQELDGQAGVTNAEPTLNVELATRGQWRDEIRRMIGISPPIDNIPGAVYGEQPLGDLSPNNTQINQAIANAIQQTNSFARFHVNEEIVIPVAVTTLNGPQTVPLSGYGGIGMQNAINDIRRVTWNDGTTTQLLQPRSYMDLDRRQWQIDMYAPGVPLQYYVSGDTLFLLPGSQLGGTLQIYAGTALTQFRTDDAIIDGLPIDFQLTMQYMAALNTLAMCPDLPNCNAFVKSYEDRVAVGMPQIRKWMNRMNRTEQASLAYASNRRWRRI